MRGDLPRERMGASGKGGGVIADRASLDAALDRIATGIVNEGDVAVLRGAVARLDEMDDLVDAVCSCRTQEIPVLRELRLPVGTRDDDAPGRP